jgi:hypothetical protein
MAGAADSEPDESTGWHLSFSPWMLWGILSFGLLAWVGFVVAAARTNDSGLRTVAIPYGVAAAIVFAVTLIVGDSEDYPVLDAIGVIVLFGTWAVSTIHAFVVNPRVRRLRSGDGVTSG